MSRIANLLLAAVVGLVVPAGCMAQDVINLPKPDKTLKTSLMDALQNRKSERSFSSREFSNQDLATLLWAANGINRPDGKRTAPSAMDARDINIYVIRKDGAYLWNPEKNRLERHTSEDIRAAVAGGQEFAANAPVCLLLVSDGRKFGLGHNSIGLADAGYVSQNICLICSAEGWACCPRASMDKQTLASMLGLTERQTIMLNNVVGYRADSDEASK